jgi:hypothetical protein
MRLALPDGSLPGGGHAAAALLFHLRGAGAAGALASTGVGLRVMGAIYRFVAANRSGLSKLVPDRPVTLRRRGDTR